MGADLVFDNQDKRVLSGMVVLSLLFHFVLYLSLHFGVQRQDQAQAETIQMEIIDTAKTEPTTESIEQLLEREKKIVRVDQQIVDQDDKALNDEVDENSRFLGKHNQKVLKQTIAQERGAFQNRKEAKPPSQQQVAHTDSFKKFQPHFDLLKAISDRDEREKLLNETGGEEQKPVHLKVDTNADRRPAQAREGAAEAELQDREVSQSVDYIKEIDPGLESALSTKEFVFHGYYTRIRRQLEQYWNPKVKSKLIEWQRKGRSIASSEDKVTRCLITLDRRGNVISVKIIGDSGWRELDEIAVEAFRSAAPFPNPPDGMMDPDGTIKLRWDFILEA